MDAWSIVTLVSVTVYVAAAGWVLFGRAPPPHHSAA